MNDMENSSTHTHNVTNSEWVYARGIQLDDLRKRQFRRQIRQKPCINGTKHFVPLLYRSYLCSSNYNRPVSLANRSHIFSVLSDGQPRMHAHNLNVLLTRNMCESLFKTPLYTLPATYQITTILDKRFTFFFVALRPNADHSLIVLEVSRSHTTTHQSVELLWKCDQLVAETSTWQNTTLTTERIYAPGGIRTHDLSRRAAADLRLRPRGHWDRQNVHIKLQKLLGLSPRANYTGNNNNNNNNNNRIPFSQYLGLLSYYYHAVMVVAHYYLILMIIYLFTFVLLNNFYLILPKYLTKFLIRSISEHLNIYQ